jgi:hypothetical protein
VQAEDKELSRPLLAGNARRLNYELFDIKADGAGFHNLEHEGMTPI